MRILILTPSAFPSISGNAITAERWRRALTQKGMDVDVLATEGEDYSSFFDHLNQFRPDVIHVHHAFKAGALLLADACPAPRQAGPAIVASPGGTDINEDLDAPGRSETVLRIFQMARVIIVQSPETVQLLRRKMPALAEKIMSVPKTVCWFGDEAYDLRTAAECSPQDIVFLLPSGIRPVKGNLECLKNMERVHRIRPGVRFIAAGPAVDPEYAGRFDLEIRRLSAFARWIKTIPPAAMHSAYQASDVVLNTSISEGLSNSLIEAIAAGRPVLASDIQGNRWPIMGEDGGTPAGLLYNLHDPEDFIEKVVRMIDDEPFRKSLAGMAFARQSRWPGPRDEADGLIAAYRAALGTA